VGAWKAAGSTPWYATSIRVGSASSSRISSSRVALLGTITRAARRSEVLIALRKNVRLVLS
jgi:hypothetical protein